MAGAAPALANNGLAKDGAWLCGNLPAKREKECKCVRVCVCDQALACPSIMQQACRTRSGRPSMSVGALASSWPCFALRWEADLTAAASTP